MKRKVLNSYSLALPELLQGKSFFDNLYGKFRRTLADLVRSTGEVNTTEDENKYADTVSYSMNLATGHRLTIDTSNTFSPDESDYFGGYEFSFDKQDRPQGRLSLDRGKGVLYEDKDKHVVSTGNLKKWWLANAYVKSDSDTWHRRKGKDSRNLRGIYRRARDKRYMRLYLADWELDRMHNETREYGIRLQYDPFTWAAKIDVSGYWAVGEVYCPSYDSSSYRFRSMVADGGGEVQSYLDCLATDEAIYNGEPLTQAEMVMFAPDGTLLSSTYAIVWMDSDLSSFVRECYGQLDNTDSIEVERWFDLTELVFDILDETDESPDNYTLEGIKPIRKDKALPIPPA